MSSPQSTIISADQRLGLLDAEQVVPMSQLGPVGKVGLWTVNHFRVVLAAWLLVAVVFGVFAPHVETALSGAGWEASGSRRCRPVS